MTLRSGLAATLGFADEVTWGTPVTPSVFLPLVDESLNAEVERIDSEGIIAGARVLRSDQWTEGGVTASGDVGLEIHENSKGLLLKHMFGGSSLVGPFTPSDLSGLGLTTQVGVPDVDTGTVHPKTLAGGKVASWEVGLVVDEIATLGLSLIGKHLINHRTVVDGATTSGSAAITSATAAFNQDDVGKPITGTGIPAGATIAAVTSTTAATLSANATITGAAVTFTIGTALASPSYAQGSPLSFVNGTVTLAGTVTKVREITLSGDNALSDSRRFVGTRAMDEPLEEGMRSYTGMIETDYFSDVAYNRFVSGAESALVLVIANRTGSKSVTFTANVRYDGQTPQVGGRGIVGQSLPFTCCGPSTDAGALTVTLDES